MGTVFFALLMFIALAGYYVTSVAQGRRDRLSRNIHDINIYQGYDDPYVLDLIKTFIKNYPCCTSEEGLAKLFGKRLREIVDASDRVIYDIRKHLDQKTIT
ncbi:hypothetical protein II582_04085 [bacterium]|nr:hypothetical protein [bacterium]